ncbi:MAG: hypothetical protein J6Z49_05640 [Kiritimatiellae bacterium]|nr:hypothetical protein [Kiritimatiellia bacterium]
MNFFSKIWRVAAYEWFDAIRSRRAIVILLLYLVTAVLGMNGSISMLEKIETQLVETLQLPESKHTGIVSTVIWKSKPFQRMVKSLTRDELVLKDITGKHPVELIYAWFAFLCAPLLVVLVAANRIPEELGSGAVRYQIFRTSRACWSLGKYMGMALMVACAIGIGALGAYVVAAFRLWMGGDSPNFFLGLLQWGFRAWIYSLAFLGLVMGLSHLTHSPNKATVLGILALVACSVLHVLASIHRYTGRLSEVWVYVERLIPSAYKGELWRFSVPPLATASASLVALGFCYLLLGYAFFRRRDV